MMVLDRREGGIVINEQDFVDALTRLILYQTKFEDLLRTVILAYKSASENSDARKEFRVLETWIHDNYLELREHLPPELKRLYLHEIAFPKRTES